MKAKMLITGATGLLGSDLTINFTNQFRTLGVSSGHFDIRNYNEVIEFFKRMKPDIVLHASAISNVNVCEDDKQTAMAVNATGAGNIARACREIGARMIYYSTDYVFDGQKGTPYTETDQPGPINEYGRSKLEGEKLVSDILNQSTIIRISWLFGANKDCFVTSTLKAGLEQIRAKDEGESTKPIKVVDDQIGSPTWTMDIAEQTGKIIQSNQTGLFHAVSEGQVSRFSLTEILFEELSWEVDLEPCHSSECALKAPRPKMTALENNRLNKLGLSVMRNYQEALREFLLVYGGEEEEEQ